jgi:hypothetical protein
MSENFQLFLFCSFTIWTVVKVTKLWANIKQNETSTERII